MVREHSDGLFEAVEILGADQHDGWSSVLGDDDALVFTLDTVDVLGEPILHGPQGLSRHGYNCATVEPQTQPRPGVSGRSRPRLPDASVGHLANGGGIKFTNFDWPTDKKDAGQNLRSAIGVWQWQTKGNNQVFPLNLATHDVEMVPMPKWSER